MSRLTSIVLASLIFTSSAAAVCTVVPQWTWNGNTEAPANPGVCNSPLVVQLTDDNGDNVIDELDNPDVVFTGEGPPSHLIAIDGRTGVTHFTTTSPPLNIGVSAADIDGDGIVELLAIHSDNQHIVAMEHDGTLKWTSEAIQGADFFILDTIAIADIDQDGSPEIVIGEKVFSATGQLLWEGADGQGRPGISGRISHAVDIDPTIPGLEVIAGNTAYDKDGNTLWVSAGAKDGWSAIADFDGDGDPEIAVVTSLESLYLIDHQGNLLGTPWPTPTFLPSQPSVADFDGDGIAEIVIVEATTMTCLEWNGSEFIIEWQVPTNDPSRISGPANFDFDGDGAAEIIYLDSDRWSVFDGSTGARLTDTPFKSATRIETPVIANIDDDCAPEILIAACVGLSGFNGIKAYECDAGVSARPIWNQYAYHATNVNDDGSIPRVETAPWTVGNSWLGQVDAGGDGPVADAGPTVTICAGETVTLDGGASMPCDPSGLEYRWLDGATVVCPWSATPTCDVAPTTTTAYTLEISCLGNPGSCAITDNARALVNVAPDLLPEDVGNTLRAIRSVSDVAMSWSSVVNAQTYSLYRGTTKEVWPAPLLTNLASISATLADIAGPPNLYLYRVTGSSCSGVEGP